MSEEQHKTTEGLVNTRSEIYESESKYRRLFENSEIPIWCDDFSDVIEALSKLRSKGIEDLHSYLNADTQHIFQISQKVKVTDINSAALSLFKVQNKEQFNELLIKSFEQGAISAFGKALCAIWEGRDSFSSEIKFLTSEGEIVDAVVTFKIPHKSEHFAYMPISIIDMTERLKLQRENIRKTQLATLGELSSKIAHEVNNPLSGVINYAQVLKNKAEKDGQETELLNRIIDEGGKIAKITKGMLNFSFDSGETKSLKDLKPIIDDVLMLTSHQVVAGEIDLLVDIPSNLPKVYCNAQQLQQVVLNIVRNACQAISTGLLDGETRGIIKIHIELTTENNQEGIALIIENNGPNIAEEQIAKIKQPFFTTKTVENGTGLGLSISNEIIQDHCGVLVIESPLGGFTKVSIKLPL